MDEVIGKVNELAGSLRTLAIVLLAPAAIIALVAMLFPTLRAIATTVGTVIMVALGIAFLPSILLWLSGL